MSNISEKTPHNNHFDDPLLALQDPDCLLCLRRKLRAISVMVFFKEEGGWRIGAYQGEKPQEDADIDSYCLLNSPLPEEIFKRQEGLVLNSEKQLAQISSRLAGFLEGHCVLGAPVRCQSVEGVRLAWRDAAEPFSAADLELIRCSGNCPKE